MDSIYIQAEGTKGVTVIVSVTVIEYDVLLKFVVKVNILFKLKAPRV